MPDTDPLPFRLQLAVRLSRRRAHRRAGARGTARTVDWRPMLLGVAFRQTGMAPLTEVPVKGAVLDARLRADRTLPRRRLPHAVALSRSRRRRPAAWSRG